MKDIPGFDLGYASTRLRLVPSAGQNDNWWIAVRGWMWLLLWGLVLAASLVQWVRCRRRHPAHSCRRCGYDLRASRESCPECGTAIAVGASIGSEAVVECVR